MYDPVANLNSLLAMLFEVVGTTISAILLPTVTLIFTPLFSILQLFQ
ncbi:MAG: hypothetical protein ABII12_08565 [Planctomycetota bacterium]